MNKKAILVLEDGFSLEGVSFGASGETFGEIVFNTSMAGYQEILTDPSYKGQIVTMTYPLIGNYGVNDEDVESAHPWAEGFIVKENSSIYSNWRAKGSLDEYLKRHKIVGISGVDTRAITRHIRVQGAMKGAISTIDTFDGAKPRLKRRVSKAPLSINPEPFDKLRANGEFIEPEQTPGFSPGRVEWVDFDKKSLLKKVKASPSLVGLDLVKDVTCSKAYDWNKTGKFKVVAFDYGAKHNILRLLAAHNCQVKVVPAKTTASEIKSLNPDGVFLSNGPADPAAVVYAIKTVKELIGKFPIFGICLGHQILGLAFGGKTYKLKFGHHGGNHPVMDLETKKVEITSQNHGFAVNIDSIPDKNVILTHKNLYDGTVEGLKHKKLPIFSVQYHPEASPGPHDAGYLFNRFTNLMEEHAKKN